MKNKLIQSIFFVLIIVFEFGCENNDKSSQSVEGNILDNNLVFISKQQYILGEMTLANISDQKFSSVITANGTLISPPGNIADVSTFYVGYVKDVNLIPGDSVKTGQVLFTMENPEYLSLQQEFLETKGMIDYLKSDYERQKVLFNKNAVSKKKYLKSKSNYQIYLAKYESLKKKLRFMNINPNTLTPNNIRSHIGIVAPINGHITSINIEKGMFLHTSDVALKVANTDSLHIELKIFEKDFDKVRAGQKLEFKVQNNLNKTYKGIVHLISKTLDQNDRSILIHADLQNPNDAKSLMPGMYIEAKIITSESSDKALPSQAVVELDSDYFVLTKVNDTTFRREKVIIGLTNNEYTQILNYEDFKSNTQFLGKGAFDLILE